MVHDTNPDDPDGPSLAELAAIETEWPLIAAEMALVDAEIRLLTAGRPSDLDWRRLRRAEHRVARELAALLSTAPATVWAALAA